jgi:organic hydroperoxide reductase OsmC/OhrA
MSEKQHQYTLAIKWTGNRGEGTSHYTKYDRSHTLSVPGKPDILCSSDVPFRGDAAKYNPEDMFLASVSSCHMLWYLHLCADAGIVVVDYTDNPTGTLREASTDSRGRFTDITLHPVVTITDASKIQQANELHDKANEMCFIANSCNFTIHHEPVCIVAEAAN